MQKAKKEGHGLSQADIIELHRDGACACVLSGARNEETVGCEHSAKCMCVRVCVPKKPNPPFAQAAE